MIIYGKYKLGNIFVPFVCYRRGHLRSNRSNTSASDDYFKCCVANTDKYIQVTFTCLVYFPTAVLFHL